MSIIQKFLTNEIASDDIIIRRTPYCPTPQHLLHMQEGVNLLGWKTKLNQNVLDREIFFENTLRRITVM